MSEPGPKITVAFVGIGTDAYEAGFEPLEGAVRDIEEVAEVLRKRPTLSCTKLLNRTRSEVEGELDKLLNGAELRGNALIVLWSGHGLPTPENTDVILALKDTKPTARLGFTATNLATLVAASRAHQILLLIDTCYSGAGVASAALAVDAVTALLGNPEDCSVAIVSSALAYQKAKDGVFAERLISLLRDGPQDPDLKPAWSAHNGAIHANDLLVALKEEWSENKQSLKIHRIGATKRPLLLANPRFDPEARPVVLEHLRLAARGVAPGEEGDYFAGRAGPIGQIVAWMQTPQPGLFVLTGPPGCGKSAIAGRIVRLSSPRERGLIDTGALAHADPGEGSVRAHVQARERTVAQVAADLGTQLGLREGGVTKERAATPAELAQAVCEQGGVPPVIVVDGLDEAREEAFAIVAELLVPLARCARLLVATRERERLAVPSGLADLQPARGSQPLPDVAPASKLDLGVERSARPTARDVGQYVRRRLAKPTGPTGEATRERSAAPSSLPEQQGAPGESVKSLLAALAPTETLDLGAERWVDPTAQDVHDYVRRRLARRTAPGMDTGAVAEAIMQMAGRASAEGGPPEGAFLLARVITSQLHDRPIDTNASGWQTQVNMSIVDAFRSDLSVAPTRAPEEGPNVESTGRGRELLETLAWSYGAGFPDDIWALSATALSVSGARYERADVFSSLIDFGRWVLSSGSGGQAAYRLSHQRITEELRPRARTAEADRELEARSLSLAQALVEHYSSLIDAGVVPTEPTYLWQYLWRHCADAGGEGLRLLEQLEAQNPGVFELDRALAAAEVDSRYDRLGRRKEALKASEEAVELYRALAADNPAFAPDLAMGLNNLGNRLSELGRRQEALAPAQEAVDLRRALAADNPAFVPDLAMSLGNLGNCLSDLGRRQEALAPAQEAVDLRRALAADNPAFVPDLAMSLNNLGNRLSELGRRQEALAPTEEAVELYRDLAADNPAFAPDLAGSLSSLGSRLAELGRSQEALMAGEEAVDLRRALAADNPAFAPDLAMGLNNLGNRLSELGRPQEALAPAQEAVDLRRALAADNPAFAPDLAMSLNNLGNRLSALGRRQEALAPTEEALELYRDLAADNPAFVPDLAGSLNNLGNRLAELGRPQEALAPAQEAVDLRRALAADNPAFIPDLAGSLNNLGVRLSALGRRQEALAPTEEALELYRALAADNPAFVPDLAMSLGNLGNCLSDLGRRQEALAPTEEAVDLRRALAADNPAFVPDLAMSLNNLGVSLSELGRRQEALAPTEEAVDLRRALAADNPAFAPDLARSLTNLGISLAELGRLQEALPPIQEAVELYRALAADNPAFVPDLAGSLTNLQNSFVDLGRAGEMDDVWESALAPLLPGVQGRLLGYRAGARDGQDLGAVGDLARALNLMGDAEPADALALRILGRERRRADPRGHDAAWQEHLGQVPAWLTLDPDLVQLAIDWISTESYRGERDFMAENEEALLGPEIEPVLDELGPALSDEELARYRELIASARAVGIESAYAERVAGELVGSWVLADAEARQLLLDQRRDELLSEAVVERVSAWAAQEGMGVETQLAAALLSLIAAGLEEQALAATADPDAIPALLGRCDAAALPLGLELARAASALFGDEPARLLYEAGALAVSGSENQVSGLMAQAATGLVAQAHQAAPERSGDWLGLFAGLVGVDGRLAIVVKALAGPAEATASAFYEEAGEPD